MAAILQLRELALAIAARLAISTERWHALRKARAYNKPVSAKNLRNPKLRRRVRQPNRAECESSLGGSRMLPGAPPSDLPSDVADFRSDLEAMLMSSREREVPRREDMADAETHFIEHHVEEAVRLLAPHLTSTARNRPI